MSGRGKSRTNVRTSLGPSDGDTLEDTQALTTVARKARSRLIKKELKSGEELPLEYLLRTMRETDEDLKAQYYTCEIDAHQYTMRLKLLQQRKDWAAEKAAPYVHPRLAHIEARVTNSEHDQWVDLMNEVDSGVIDADFTVLDE